MNWTDEQIEKLILFYSCNTFLYDQSAVDYHNRTKRRVFLQTLATDLGISGKSYCLLVKYLCVRSIVHCAILGYPKVPSNTETCWEYGKGGLTKSRPHDDRTVCKTGQPPTARYLL